VRAAVSESHCRVELWGQSEGATLAGLRFAYQPGRRRGDQVVVVYRQVRGTTSLLSQNTYRRP